MGNSKATSDFRRRRKENLIKVMGSKCAICGYDKAIGALEFHHLVPEEKSYGLSAQGTCHDLERDLEEVQKCILVCANCHREIHNNFYSLEELKNLQYYDKDFAKELILDRNIKNGTVKMHYYCSECGKEITKDSKSGLCEICVKKQQRFCERPSREELKTLIRTMPFTKIGEKFGVSDNAIRKWCDAENLPRKVSDIKSYSNEEWELV